MNNCPGCGTKSVKIYITALETHGRSSLDNKVKYSYLRCTRCGCVFLNGVKLNSKYYRDFYSEKIYKKKSNFINRVEKIFINYSSNFKAKTVKKYNNDRRKKSILDVGCGNGFFLEYLNNNRFVKYGVEINEKLAKFCKKRGIQVYKDDFQKIDFGERKYDIVTMWHVLEHISSPNNIFKKVNNILNKDGRFIFTVPNIESYGFKLSRTSWFHMDAPRHVFFPTSRTVKILAKNNNFHLEEFRHFIWEFPLDLFWSVKNTRFKIPIWILYPIVKILDRETLTYVLKKI